MVGSRAPNLKAWTDAGHPPLNCTYEQLAFIYCANGTDPTRFAVDGGYIEQQCDQHFALAVKYDLGAGEDAPKQIRYERAITGLASGSILGAHNCACRRVAIARTRCRDMAGEVPSRGRVPRGAVRGRRRDSSVS